MMIGATMMGSASPSALGSSNVASSSRLPSSSPIPPRHHPSSMSPAHYHGSLGRGTATPSLDASSRAASSAKGSMKLAKAASPSLPIDHDFVVQAANPNHPEHQRWLESFAPSTSSRRRKSDSNPAGSEASPARRKPSRTDLGNGSARSREASDNVALASDSASRTSHLTAPRSVAVKGSRGSDSHGRRLGVAASTGGATNSSDSSADDVAASAIRPTSPYRSRRRPAAEPRAEDTQTTPAKGSPAVYDAAHGNGSPAERRRKKKRDRSKRREAPAPPMPPPRISSSVNYQAFQSPFIDADSPQQAYEAPMPAMPGEIAQFGAQGTTQPPAAVAGPSQVSEPKFKPRSRPQPSQSDIQLLRDAGIGPEVPSKDQTLPLRLASRPPAQQQQGLPSLPPRHPGRQAALPQATTPNRLVSSPTASRRPHEELLPETSRSADEPEPQTMPRQRSTSFDMLRQAVGFSPTPAFADGGSSSKAALPASNSGSRIRASLDGVRPRFLTFTRGGSVPPDDASEADSSVAGGSARAPSSSSARGGKKLRNLFSSLKLGSSSKGSNMLSRHNNVSASTLPIDDASAEGIDRSRGHSEPAQYAPRSTQSMDLPRPSLGTMAGAGRSESPAMASLPGQYNTVDAALGPMAAWGKSSKARLSLVGEETEEDSDHPRKSLGISAAERERAARQAAVAPPSPIAEVNEATRGAIGFPTKSSSSSRYDARPDRSPSNSTRSVARSRAETPYDAQSPMSNKTPKEGSSDTFGRKNRLAALWARSGSNASSSRRERSETTGSDGVTQKEILVEWERASSTVSLRMASGHRAGHSQGDSLDASASLADSCDTTGTTGLGIVAMEPSNADSPVIDSLPPAPSGSGWRSRVPSLASIKSARRARSQQYLREAASTPAPPPLPTSPGQQFGPSTPASAVPSVQASANGSVGSDELWRRNLLAEAVSLSLDNANGGAKSVTVADSKSVASPRSPTSNGPSKGKRTPLLEVVAAGRKSFSRDRGKSKGLDAPDESVPTIHKTLGPALLSDLASQDGHSAREEEQSLDASAFYSDDDLEPWDGMDDEAAPASRLAAAPRKPSVGGTPTLEGIAEQDTTSTEGSRSQSQPGSHQSPPLAPGATSSSTTSPLASMPASSGAQTLSTTPATTPSAQTVRSFSGKRASMGKMQSPPPQLQLHSPYNTPFRSPAGGTAAAETAGDSGRFDDFVAPSPTQVWSRSPSQPTAPSSSGRRTPRSVNRLFSSSSQQARNTPSPSPGGVSPSPNSRTSFSTDRDRAPVASPYVQHQGLRSGGKQPGGGGIKGALKKLAPGASPASNGSSSPIGRGISSEQFSQQQQQQRLSFGDSREDLLPEDSSPEGGALAGRPRFQPSPSSLSGLRDPWDDSLASAQAATRMLEVESETLQPSPRTPQRYGGNGNGGAPWSAGGGGGDQVSIHSSLSSRSDFFPGGASGAEDTASDPRSATPAAMAMNRGMMSSASSLQAAIVASSGNGNGSANFMSRSTSASDVHDPATTTTAPLASHHEGAQASPQTPSRSSAAHATFYTPPTAQSMLPTSSLASMPSTSSAASASASTSASASASLSGSTSSQSHTNFLPSPSNSSQVSLSLSQHQQMQQPTTPTAADPLEALFRQQKAREAEMLRSISERSRKVVVAQGGQGQGQGGTPPQQRGQQRV